MMTTVSTPEFQSLTTAWQQTEKGNLEYPTWEASPFKDLRLIPSSSRRGKLGKLLTRAWLRNAGFELLPAGNRTFTINGIRFQVRFSTLWEDSNTYTFSQIRKDHDYDFLILLGVSPTTAHAWIVSKEKAIANTIGQHTGSDAKETRWVRVDPKLPPVWLIPSGGELSKALRILSNITDASRLAAA